MTGSPSMGAGDSADAVSEARKKVVQALMSGIATAAGIAMVNFVLETHISTRGRIVGALGSAALAMLGAFAVYREGHRAPVEREQLRIEASLASGLYGGLAGGALSGLVAGPLYYFANHDKIHHYIRHCSPTQIIRVTHDPVTVGYATLVFLYCSGAGLLVGTLIQLSVLGVYRYVSHPTVKAINEVGAVAGGVVGGMLAGALGGILFGRNPTPMVSFPIYAAASVVGAAWIAFGALLYEYRGQYRLVFPALAFSILISCASIGLWGLWWYLEPQVVAKAAAELDTCATYGLHAHGGAIFGAIGGSVLGLQVGCTLLISRLRTGMSQPRDDMPMASPPRAA